MRCCTTKLRFLGGTDGDDDGGGGGGDRNDGDDADSVHDCGDDDRTLRGTCATLRKCRISVPGF